tara:strand:- start:285 stop:473 length:189 start_codon:yes stop_codon:yes gene_type:complete
LNFIEIQILTKILNNSLIKAIFHNILDQGRMVELVDAPDSKSGDSNILRVRVSLRPPSYGDK